LKGRFAKRPYTNRVYRRQVSGFSENRKLTYCYVRLTLL